MEMTQIKAKRISIALLTFITLQGLPVFNQRVVTAQQAEVAIVVQLEGSVWLQRDKKSRVIREFMLLNVGDIIRTDNSGRAVIYQAYAPVARLRANQSQTIKKLAPPPSKNGLTAAQYASVLRQNLNAKQRRSEPSPREMGGPYGAALTLFDMRNSTVMEREPTFNWTRVPEAMHYVINVYDRNEKIIWSAKTTETRFAYPKNRPPLTPGEYKWEVTARVKGNTMYHRTLYDATTFTVVSKERAEEIETDLAMARASFAIDDGTANLVYISALIEYKRFSEAEKELKASLERSPRDQTLWALLMEIYWQMKLWGAREDARLLSEEPNLTVEMIRALKARR